MVAGFQRGVNVRHEIPQPPASRQPALAECPNLHAGHVQLALLAQNGHGLAARNQTLGNLGRRSFPPASRAMHSFNNQRYLHSNSVREV
jgi:hypothetical protein